MARDSSSGLSSVLVRGEDTIVACATPQGRGALAIVRASGPAVRRVAERVAPSLDFKRPWCAQLVELVRASGGPFEQGLAIPYCAPRSYTGEDLLEIVVHGSPILVDTLIEALTVAGARPAQPGEFTRRAIANGKMDIVQAEGVRDLIAAESRRQLNNARRQQSGELSEQFNKVKEQLLGFWAMLEASLEFAAQGVAVESEIQEAQRVGVLTLIDELLENADAGQRLREGVIVVIVGPPNAGKSTLFNALAGEERAIVNPQPGTTRDVVEARVEIDGLVVSLCDTAGLRESEDEIEKAGVARAVSALASADLVVELFPFDEPQRCGRVDEQGDRPCIRVRSKADLLVDTKAVEGEEIAVSALTGEGMQELRAEIRKSLACDFDDTRIAISRRHRECLETAKREILNANLEEPELAAENLRAAAGALAELVGEVDSEDVLDRVFSGFCIGK